MLVLVLWCPPDRYSQRLQGLTGILDVLGELLLSVLLIVGDHGFSLDLSGSSKSDCLCSGGDCFIRLRSLRRFSSSSGLIEGSAGRSSGILLPMFSIAFRT